MDEASQFAVCVFADTDSLLTPRKIYQLLPDESAARSDYVRVIDDEGEDYLYPKKFFVFVSLPVDAAKAILHTS